MAITVAMRTEISQLYVALFGRAPDSDGLGFWVNLRNSGQSMTQIANAMYATAPAREYFPSWLTNQEIISSFYTNVLGRTADATGLAFWTAKLNAAGATPGSVITEMITAVANYTGTDPDGLLSAALFANKVQVAQYYAEHGGDIASADDVLEGVTDQDSTVDDAIADIDNGTVGGAGDPQTLKLEITSDDLTGGGANDMFVANVEQNALGQQVNTLGSGDELNGGGGNDTLMAKVTAGAYVNGGPRGTMPIQPATSSIETVKFEAVNSGIGVTDGPDVVIIPVLIGDNGPISVLGDEPQQIDPYGLGQSETLTTTVYINAKDMLGVETIGSWHSDANLVIQNMTTQDNSGNATNLSEMTVVMGYTGNSDSHWTESDLSVYFDQDYLNPETFFSNPSVDIRLMNEDNYDDNPDEPLAGVYIEKLVITLGGGGDGVRSYSLAQYIGELGGPNSDPDTDYIKTYDELLAALQDAVAALKADHPEDAALQSLEATLGDDFFADISPLTGLQRRGESMTLSIEGATNGEANTLVVNAQDLVLDPIATTDIRNSNRFERAEATPATPSTELSIQIDLEKVGLAGDGGELIVGSMFKDGQNDWSDLYDGKGIAVFNVTVSGGGDKPSSLAGMHSTGNNLREVNVVTNSAQTGTFADLTIGNSNTRYLELPQSMELGDVVHPSWRNEGALKDVQTFDASGFKGDLTLYAALTDQVTEKYMNLVDAAPAEPTADNVQFEYTGGTGNDYINLWLSDENLAKAGTTTREDFNLTIHGGAGNDELVTMIGNGSAGRGEDRELDDNIVDSSWDNWYQNSAINANLHIHGDAGNDTIRTLGSGNWVIDGGTGDDTIYADNTGARGSKDGDDLHNDGKATWVFNSINTDVDDLLSHNAASVQAVNAQLTVHFMGYSKTVTIANSVGALNNVTINDLHINQAIKAAINLDPVLSKLLVAEDGPARTLVVRSLIDGEMDDGWADYNQASPIDNLSVRFSTLPLTVGQTNPGLVLFSAASTGTLLDGYNPAGDATFGSDGGTLRGEDSDNVADNEIEGDTGNDVIVLGTGTWSNDTLVYESFNNGTDYIVNFQDNYTTGEGSWNGGEDEVITLTFTDSDGAPANQTIAFDGETVTLAAPVLEGVIPAIDVAFQFSEQFDSVNWAVVSWNGASSVTLQRKAPGDFADPVGTTAVTLGDFSGTYFAASTDPDGQGNVTVLVNTQGADVFVPGTPTVFTVNFDTPTTAAAAADPTGFSFAGVDVPFAAGDGSVTVVNKIVAAAAAFTAAGWTVAETDNNEVTFTEIDPVGPVGFAAPPVPTAASVGLNTNNVFGTIAGSVGTVTEFVPPVFTAFVPGPVSNFDFIDFSWYDPTGVLVNDSNQVNDVVIGAVGGANGTSWVTMTELTGTGNDGVYRIELVTAAGAAGSAGDTTQLIGIADFGYEKDFTEFTFFI